VLWALVFSSVCGGSFWRILPRSTVAQRAALVVIGLEVLLAYTVVSTSNPIAASGSLSIDLLQECPIKLKCNITRRQAMTSPVANCFALTQQNEHVVAYNRAGAWKKERELRLEGGGWARN